AHQDGGFALAVSADGKFLVTAGADRKVKAFKADGTFVREFGGSTDWLYSVAISPDGRRVAAGGWNGETRIWDFASGKPVARLAAAATK
ncbi:MAG TPA: hypothetical protein VNC50_04055, partial [Planctomycetia bacterium]|nr:hypothetical protein [Planctomycetia bacterium]